MIKIAWEICGIVWEGKGYPQGWKEGIIVPLAKKEERICVQEYKGVTPMPTLYCRLQKRRHPDAKRGKGATLLALANATMSTNTK